jgi:hypothetical protein
MSEENRRFGIEIKEEYKHIDSVQISIPAGYEMETKSADLEISGKFGKYSQRTIVTADRIIYYRLSEQYSGRFPASEYENVVKFYNGIYDADHASMVLVKKN